MDLRRRPQEGLDSIQDGLVRNCDVAPNVDVTTLRFEGATPFHDPPSHLEDVDGDGDVDLVAHFATSETGIAFGQTEACLEGDTPDGLGFGGCDAIHTVPACGLGFELALLLPGLMWLRQRRRRR
jgi:hypothetical protein